MGVSYDINDASCDSGGDVSVEFVGTENLTRVLELVTEALTTHSELKSQKDDLLNDLQLAWQGESKLTFDNCMLFADKFLNDLKPALDEFKKVIEGGQKVIGEVSGQTPTPKAKAKGVELP